MRRAGAGTYTKYCQPTDSVDEVLEAKLDQLRTEKFKGRMIDFAVGVSQGDLLSDFRDEIDGIEFPVSMGRVGAYYSNTPWLMVRRYFELKGENKLLLEFRPWHMHSAPKCVYVGCNGATIHCDELLVRRLHNLHHTLFEGDFEEFREKCRLEDILAPFIDTVAGHKVPVSMGAAVRARGYCRSEILGLYDPRFYHA